MFLYCSDSYHNSISDTEHPLRHNFSNKFTISLNELNNGQQKTGVNMQHHAAIRTLGNTIITAYEWNAKVYSQEKGTFI